MYEIQPNVNKLELSLFPQKLFPKLCRKRPTNA